MSKPNIKDMLRSRVQRLAEGTEDLQSWNGNVNRTLTQTNPPRMVRDPALDPRIQGFANPQYYTTLSIMMNRLAAGGRGGLGRSPEAQAATNRRMNAALAFVNNDPNVSVANANRAKTLNEAWEIQPNSLMAREKMAADARRDNAAASAIPAESAASVRQRDAQAGLYQQQSRVQGYTAEALGNALKPDPALTAAFDLMNPGLAGIGSSSSNLPLFARGGGGERQRSMLDLDEMLGVPRLQKGTEMVYAGGEEMVPGEGTGDKVPALLEPREAVLNVNAAEMLGRDTIKELNDVGNALRQRFQKGTAKVMKYQQGTNDVGEATRQIREGGLLGGLKVMSDMLATNRTPAPRTPPQGVTREQVIEAWKRRQSGSVNAGMPAPN